jgi:hypothetical protein
MGDFAKFKGKLPLKVRGAGYEFWTGVIGISETLVVFDGDVPMARASEIAPRRRQALALRMVDLWMKFAKGEKQ